MQHLVEGGVGPCSWETIRRVQMEDGLYETTRQPGLIREVHQLGSRKQPEVFRGRRVVTWCPGFAYQSFDGCQADDAQAK